MEFFSLIPALCTAVTSHPVPLHLSHCCCELPPKLLLLLLCLLMKIPPFSPKTQCFPLSPERITKYPSLSSTSTSRENEVEEKWSLRQNFLLVQSLYIFRWLAFITQNVSVSECSKCLSSRWVPWLLTIYLCHCHLGTPWTVGDNLSMCLSTLYKSHL